MEVITRVERRRQYSDEERAAVLEQCDELGATVVGVSRRLGISASLIHGWRKTRREAERIASEPLQFIPYGVVADAAPPEPVVALALATPVERKSAAPAREVTPAPDDLVRPHPGSRPGGIDIDLASGVRLSVDSYVNEKALARVLRALREAS
ncbi:IS66-like element accessory protein TnpA [Sphingomonas sp. BE138]|uniref:IS66-like element accessory protein TnpA n=1 Tax=Sphingomonas sp. BE138 TaxID=2817845 RepID=UPI002869F569|nr:transposase [Sphingomonas sp. BE138]